MRNFEWTNITRRIDKEGNPKLTNAEFLHHYLVNKSVVFVCSNEKDMQRFDTEMLRWTEEEMKDDIPQIDMGMLSDACEYGTQNGHKFVLIDYQMDPKKGFFGYNTLMEAWTVYQR